MNELNLFIYLCEPHPFPPKSTAIQALKLVPAFVQSATFDEIKHFVDFYHTDLPSPSAMPSELRLWQKTCESMLSKPETVAGALKVCYRLSKYFCYLKNHSYHRGDELRM